MKVIVIGASGTIGKAISEELKQNHEVIRAGRNGLDAVVDITSVDSIKSMYERIGKVDAVVSATGSAHFGSVSELTPELNEIGINSKLKGQINLVLLGMDYINDGGSFTLTTGIIMDDPIRQGASAAMANGGVKAFVKCSAIEMPRGIRINSVSPNVLQESLDKYGAFFPGFNAVPASRVALAFRKSVDGAQTGQNYEVY
ncbi:MULTISPECIES: short chain dehydrogenase [Photorhabdus]|uniref:Short chain dehydrogenase n=2 Tax=Photorhabdus TaxID=29487 RepID=A0ABX0B5P3_9GAMM|nr:MULTISPECIES: short chain dehydrogenase [Photorhabdus]MCC8373520.1 short chain dehydrogenase [Photorhabdus bodei]MCC8464839.1 short chain dehydrogenase [Photorhabdus bodei]MCT8350521.1 short chain dehydrogenase [Photorhabdus kayaii]MDB6366598.1 short chain dehydrogenase [Photorhabdus bodei]MDB6372664.1 short chain dehydrogenase [Photorhabdus bodei]